MLLPSSSQSKYLEEASQRYHEQLQEHPNAGEYLASRGLTEELISRFRLGVVDAPSIGHESYKGCLSIPYLSNYGVLSIRWRPLYESDAKYLTSPGDHDWIYNPQALERGTRGICICEGEFDTIIAESAGLPSIGLPGSTKWENAWTRLLSGYQYVVLLQDDDEAGRKMAAKLGKILRNLRPVVMDGGDVNSFFLQHGAEALREKVLG